MLHELPHASIGLNARLLEEVHRWSALEHTVGDLGLIGQVLHVRDGQVHLLDGEERGQVGRVRGDYDESEEPPDAADQARGQRLGIYVGALLHQSAHCEPEAVPEGELILDELLVLRVAGVGLAPLVGREASQGHHGEADQDVGDEREDPDLQRERIQEREEARFLARGHFVEDAYAQAQEGLGEVDGLLTPKVDGERGDGKVGFLLVNLSKKDWIDLFFYFLNWIRI